MQFASGIQSNQGVLAARTRALQSQENVQVRKLSYGQIQTIEARPGLEILTVQGVLWITQEGEQSDILVRAGRRWTANKSGRVIVQAIVSDATWTMRAPVATRKMPKWLRVLNAWF